jgi:peptide/nickel transport system permease protein
MPAAPEETLALPTQPRLRRQRLAVPLGLRDPYALAGFAIYLFFVLVALLGNRIAPYPPLDILFTPDGDVARNLPLSLSHPLGTTQLGHDIFSQLVLGTRAAFIVGITAAVAVVVLGTLIGLVSGYFGGWVDAVLMRLADLALAIPVLPFIIALAALARPSMWNVVIGVAALLWPNAARVIRSQVLTLRERAFVEAARVTGAGPGRIIFVHIAPNILPLSLLYGSIAIGWAILTDAAVNFLGFGPSNTVSWGSMLQDAFASQALSRAQYAWFVPPGICIVLMVLAGFLISRGYEEILLPKLRD